MNKKRNRASAKVHRGAVILSFCIALFGFAADAQDTVTYNKAVKASGAGKACPLSRSKVIFVCFALPLVDRPNSHLISAVSCG